MKPWAPLITTCGLLAGGAALAGHDTQDTTKVLHLHDDVNRDYRGDIFFGQGTALAYSTAGTAASGVYAGDGGPRYRVVAVSDFDGDRSADVLWSNGSHLKLWINNSSGDYTPVSVGHYAGGWEPFAAGDINADGRADLFFRGSTHLAYWLMNGASVIRSSYAGDGGPGYRVVAVGNLSGRDRDNTYAADVLWTNGSRLKAWVSDAATVTFRPYDLGSYGGGWEPFALGDINGDGTANILFRGGSHLAYWEEQRIGGEFSRHGETFDDFRYGFKSIYAGDAGSGFRAISVSNYGGEDVAGDDVLWTNGSELKIWSSTCPVWDWDQWCVVQDFVPISVGRYGGGWQPLDLLLTTR